MKLVLYERIKKGATIIVGPSSIGLVGTIATFYLSETVGYKYVGFVDSEELAPIASIHHARVFPPIRLYYNPEKNVVVFVIEIALTPKIQRKLADLIIKFAKKIKAKAIFVLTGMSGEGDSVYLLSTDKEFLKKSNMKTLEEGVIAGTGGLLLLKGYEEKVKVHAILAESTFMADVPAALRALKTLSKLTGMEIDLKALIKESRRMKEMAKRKITTERTFIGKEMYG